MKHFFFILLIWEALSCEYNITEDLLDNDIITLQCLLSGSAQCSWKRKDNYLTIDERYKYLNRTGTANQNDCSIVISKPKKIDVAMWYCESMTSDSNLPPKINSTNCSTKAIKFPITIQSTEAPKPTNTPPSETAEPNIQSENVSFPSKNETSPTKDLKPILYTFVPAFGALAIFVLIAIIFTASKFGLKCTKPKKKLGDAINIKLEEPIQSGKRCIGTSLDGYFSSNSLVDGSHGDLYADVIPDKSKNLKKRPNLFSLTPTLKFKRNKNKILDPQTSSVVNLTQFSPSSSSVSNNANVSTTTIDSTANESRTSHDYEYIDNTDKLINPLIRDKSKLNASFDVVSSRKLNHSNEKKLFNSRHSCSTTQLPQTSIISKPNFPLPLEPPPIVKRRLQQPIQVSTPKSTKRTVLTPPRNYPKEKAPPLPKYEPHETEECFEAPNGTRNCMNRPSYLDILETTNEDQCNIYTDALSCHNDNINISIKNKSLNRENKPLIKI